MARASRSIRTGALIVLLAAGAAACGGGSSTTATGIVTPSSTGFVPAGGTAPPPASAAPSSTTTTVAGTSTTLGKPTLNDASAISTVGLDKVHFGMTAAEAEQAAGAKLVAEANKNAACYLATPDPGPKGVAFLLANGRVERVDIGAGSPIATRSGIKVGSTEAQVKQAYGAQIQVQPRFDGQPGNALVYVPKDEADAKFRLAFLTDGTTVQSYRAGRLPQVLAPTGCGT